MTIEGKQIIGQQFSAAGSERFQPLNPATGERLPYHIYYATAAEADEACRRAAVAFQRYRKKSGAERASFLEAIAANIRAAGALLIDTCMAETALPKARLEGERERTANQLLLFADLLREGSWLNARIETAKPDRTPLPKPDIRSMEVALGPTVVFGASNFPLAFSVAGGDTASALAAGCTVVVKAHPAHPGTSELVAKAIRDAAADTGMPDGVFSMLHGEVSIGMQLVKHDEIRAVGFTGSYRAGKAIFDAGASRPVPIPVYAEMGSVNPVFILPEAARERGEAIAQGFAASVTLGVGQFCTNPGTLIYTKSAASATFERALQQHFDKSAGGVMLAETIHGAYTSGIAAHATLPNVTVLAKGSPGHGALAAEPVLFKTEGDTFMAQVSLAEEIFGPTSVVVEASTKEEMLAIANRLHGHLTVTVHGTESDLLGNKDLLDILEQKAGRVVINGYPTGVEVCHAMVHGGPFPATADGRSTSVGSAAIHRFTRPVAYQSLPQALLPAELRNDNPLGIWRLVNGERTRDSIA